VAAGQRRRGQRTGGLPAGRLLAVPKSAVPRRGVPKSGGPRSAVLRSAVLRSGVRRQGGRPGTGHGPPAGHPVRRHRPVRRGTGPRAHRDPAAGRPGRGRPDAVGILPRRDPRRARQPAVRRPPARPPGRCPLDRGRPHGPQSRPGRPGRCQAHGGRWSAGCHRGCGRGRAGRCSRRCGGFRLPAMTCVACPGCSGESRCGTRPARPHGKRPCPVRRPFHARPQFHGWPQFREGLQLRGRQTIPGRHPFPGWLQSHGRLHSPGRLQSPGWLQSHGWLQSPGRLHSRGKHQSRGRQTTPVTHRFRGKLRFRELPPPRVRHLPSCPGRGDSPPGWRSAPHLSPGSGNSTLPGRAARGPRRAGYPRCWRGGPCFRRPRSVRYRPGPGHYRGAGPCQCCWRARGWRRPHGRDQRRRWGVPGSAVLPKPGSGRAPRRRIGRRPGPARLPRSVLRSS
jgi:hypothetical protein